MNHKNHDSIDPAPTGLKAPGPKIVPENLLFFVSTTAIALIGGPLYLSRYDFRPSLFWLTLFFLFVTSISISAGYHRLFSHRAYKAHPIIQFLFLFWGAGAFQHSAIRWSSQHRNHHRFVATDLDPYSIGKGFFYSHIGWLLFWEQALNYDNVRDLKKNPLIAHQNSHYYLWALTSGVALPLLIGLSQGQLLGAFIFAVCARLVFVHQATFCVNSVCHVFGKEPYDLQSTAKDNWIVALFTNGEGHHNYHHRFQNDYRNGIYWYQWDLAKWLITLLSWVGLASGLHRKSRFEILEARLETNQQRLRNLMAGTEKPTHLEHYYEDLEASYNILQSRLLTWKRRSGEYQDLFHGKIPKIYKNLLRAAKLQMKAAKRRFLHNYKQRVKFIRSGQSPHAKTPSR